MYTFVLTLITLAILYRLALFIGKYLGSRDVKPKGIDNRAYKCYITVNPFTIFTSEFEAVTDSSAFLYHVVCSNVYSRFGKLKQNNTPYTKPLIF